ncbi:carbohydrate kinase, partial [Burkholderia pseudomallei]
MLRAARCIPRFTLHSVHASRRLSFACPARIPARRAQAARIARRALHVARARLCFRRVSPDVSRNDPTRGGAMTEPCVLAIDLGTSGPKAAIISLDGRVVAAARDAVATLRMPDGGVEQDPLAVWRAVKRACG